MKLKFSKINVTILTSSAWFSTARVSTGATDEPDILDKHVNNFDRINMYRVTDT